MPVRLHTQPGTATAEVLSWLLRGAAALCLSWAPLRAQDVPEPTSLPPVNPTCPILEGEAIDPDLTLLYHGVAVGMCCEDCQRKFLRDPERWARGTPELAAAFAAAAIGSTAAVPPAGVAPTPPGPQATAADPAAPDRAPAAQPRAPEEVGMPEQLGRLHPVVVHFPIALLLAAALGEALVCLGWSSLAGGAAFAQRLGVLGALAAAPLGLLLEAHSRHAPSLTETAEWHERWGLLCAGLALASLLLAEKARRGGPAWMTPAYRVLLWAAAAAVCIAGSLGGRLVWGADFLPF